MAKKIEMLGKRFGRLVVISEFPQRKNNQILWVCKCDCGNTTNPIYGAHLRNGETKSCGCIPTGGAYRIVHGHRHERIYSVWRGIKIRCLNTNSKHYKDYGGRGITVCEEWKDSFQTFYDYVSKLAHFGEKGYSIDRINNDGNYEPGNVRWATAKEQANNKRRNKKD